METGSKSAIALQHIVDHLPVVVFEYIFFPDGSRDFSYLSPRCEEILKLDRKLLLSGKIPMKDFIHPDDWKSLKQEIAKNRQKPTVFKWEGRVQSEGKWLWVEAKGSLEIAENGNIVCSGLINEITERKLAEEREAETERKHRDLLAFLPISIAIHAQGRLMYVNSYCLDMMGAKREEELLGKEAIQFVHPAYRPLVKERIKLVQQGHSVPFVEEQLIRLDGKIIDVQSSALPIVYQGVEAVQNIAVNITGQKEAELNIRKVETLFTQLFNNVPLAIVILEANGCVVNMNKGFEETFGYTLDDLKGKHLEEFIVPQELSEEGTEINTVISNEGVIQLETRRMRKDKVLLNVILYGLPVRLQDQTIGIFGVYVDITRQKGIEQELKTRNDELDNFVYKVSHDLRAPLASILGLVNLAKMPGNTDSLEDYIKIIGKKTEELDLFIRDVLSHSKNLKQDIQVARVDFTKLIEEAFAGLHYLSGADRITREIVIEGINFYSDPWRINEIFRNLISNSIKYRDRKKQNSLISITIRIDEERAWIDFTDNGIGIEEDQLGNIFNMFYRASEISQGSGIGLYIVKGAIEKLGGKIEVKSKLKAGTTFSVILPNNKQSIENDNKGSNRKEG